MAISSDRTNKRKNAAAKKKSGKALKKKSLASARPASSSARRLKAAGSKKSSRARKGSKKSLAESRRTSSKKRAATPAKKRPSGKARKATRVLGAKKTRASKPAAARKSAPAAARKVPAGKKKAVPSARRSERLEDIDRDLADRIHELKEEIAELGGEIFYESGEEMSEELEEAFLESVLEVESAGWTKPFDLLVESGIALPSPGKIPDSHIEGKLWEVINALALVNVFLDRTDHLSDRELYSHLWNESLREEMIIIPHNPGFQSHIDVIGSGSDEDTSIWLRFYADDEDRSDWAEQFPDFPMPTSERPPNDRDARLPRPGGESQSAVH
jgi:hypothetical protein